MISMDDGTPERLEEIAATHTELRTDAVGLDDAAVREPTDLPGWTRGHVVTHLAELAAALARQARYALDGRVVEVYDGGRPARDVAIERGARRSALELSDALQDSLTDLEQTWAELAPDDWRLRCTFRDGDLLATQLCWWREVHIHYADLGIGYAPQQWSDALGEHLVDFLSPRLPTDRTAVLLATDTGRSWEFGSGASVTIRGPQNSLAAWLAGRSAAQLPEADGPSGQLPELGAWP